MYTSTYHLSADTNRREQGSRQEAALKVLVVDDELPIVEAVAYSLKKEGYTVLTATDAEQCMEAVKRDSPSLVLLDVMLPSASGFDVCRMLRKQTDVPIIMLTARAEETDRVVGLELGADDYVTKAVQYAGTHGPREKRFAAHQPAGNSWRRRSSGRATSRLTRTATKSASRSAPSRFRPKNSNCCAFSSPIPVRCFRGRFYWIESGARRPTSRNAP